MSSRRKILLSATFSIAVLLLVFFIGISWSRVLHLDSSIVFCHKEGGVGQVFAVKRDARKNLDFGLSLWFPNGSNLLVFGKATISGPNSWIYKGGDPSTTCSFTVQLESRTAVVKPDPQANCSGQGGYGTSVYPIKFSPSDYEGHVTNELKDAGTFFNTAGRCLR